MSRQTRAAPARPASFQHRSRSTCRCLIHADGEPFTAPLGLRFAEHVTVDPIPRETAAAIYEAHHSYMDSLPSVNLFHHGIQFQENLVGAITYRYPLISRKRIRYRTDGQLVPEPVTIDEDLPRELRPTARRILDEITPTEVVDDEIIGGDTLVEAARICLGVRMPNLASAALARSQERFVDDYADEEGTRFLLTWVRADYDGAMIRALRDKGWTCTGFAEPSEASNRENKAIRKRWKWRFLCPLNQVKEQSTLDSWT